MMCIYSYHPSIEQDPISKKLNRFSLKDEENPTKDNGDSKSCCSEEGNSHIINKQQSPMEDQSIYIYSYVICTKKESIYNGDNTEKV